MPRTVQQPDSVDRSRQIREWIVALAENFGADLSVARIDLLEAGLADLNLEQIHTAFKLCALRRERFFPSLAELRGYVDGGTKQTADAIDDELVWEQVLEHCRKYVWVDGGKYGPPLAPALAFAARVAGGLGFLESCSERDLIFAKQRFLEALAGWRNGAENFAQLPEGPAKKLISGVAAAKQLPAVEAYYAGRAIGESYRKRLGDYSAEVRPLAASSKKVETRPTIATSGRLELLERQKAELLAKSSQDEIRRAAQLRAMCERGAR